MVLSKSIPVEQELPPVDERIVPPETRLEMVDGELIYVPPAEEPHADRHSKAAALLELHVRPEFNVAAEMLTRTSITNDFAPDVSVYPRARHPRTGGRQLEELAFEIVSTGSLGKVADKAAKLIARGVRRVFALDIPHSRMLEWSSESASWRELAPHGYIEDPTLAAPLPIDDLIHAARMNDAVQRSLIAQGNAVLDEHVAHQREQARREGREQGQREGLEQGQREGLEQGQREGLEQGQREGREQGQREGLEQGQREGLVRGLLALLAARGIPLRPEDRAHIVSERDLARLERWLARAARCASIAEVLATP